MLLVTVIICIFFFHVIIVVVTLYVYVVSIVYRMSFYVCLVYELIKTLVCFMLYKYVNMFTFLLFLLCCYYILIRLWVCIELYHQLFKALRAVRQARCPNLRVSVSVPNEFTLRATFGVIFRTCGHIFKVIFGPWGQAQLQCLELAWGTKSALGPKGRPEVKSPIWRPF